MKTLNPDGQDPHETGFRSRSEALEPSDMRVGRDQDPLLQLLRLLSEEQGTTKTGNQLGVDRKTVWRALDAATDHPGSLGALTPTVRLANAWLAANGASAADAAPASGG